MPTAQDHRYRQLAGDYNAVAAVPLADGHMILSARGTDGKVAHVEVLDRAGQPLAVDQVARVLGFARSSALTLADQVTTHLVDYLKLRELADEDLNLSAIARDTNIARQTLYNRLEAADVAPPAPTGRPPAPRGAAKAA